MVGDLIEPASQRKTWDWVPPRLVECKRCGYTALTRHPAPKCPRCGAREDE